MFAGTSSGEASSSIEQEKYFMLLVAATPSSSRSHNSASYSDSLTSLNSLMMVGGSDSLNIPETPDLHLRPSYKAGSATRGNGNRKNKPACELCSLVLLSVTSSHAGVYTFPIRRVL